MNFDVTLLSGAMAEGRLFGLDQQTFISIAIQLLNACILAVALGFILYKPVREYMQNRTNRIDSQLNGAQNKMAQADKLKAEYEKKLSEIDKERAKILESAKRTAAQSSKNIIDEARSEAAAIRRRTAKSISGEKQRLKEETRQYIIEVSALMAAKFVDHTIDSKTQDRIFDETIAQLEEAKWLS